MCAVTGGGCSTTLCLTHAMTMTLKSSQFHGSLRKVKGSHTETPRQDLYEGLEGVDTCEGVPERGREGMKRKGRGMSNGRITRWEKGRGEEEREAG